jgi:chemotaxis protein CheX
MTTQTIDLHQAIATIVTSVCDVVLGLEVIETWTMAAPAAGARSLVGCVHIAGEWNGSVLLCCDASLAALAARSILGEEGVGFDGEYDAFGELTNMVAGNLKALLPAPSVVSVPAVAEGCDLALSVPRSRVVERVAFVVAGEHRLVVGLMARAGRDGVDHV